MTTRRTTAVVALIATAAMLAACSAGSPVRLQPVSEPARHVSLPGAAVPPVEPSPPAGAAVDDPDRLDALSDAAYWDVHDGVTWEYRITTSQGLAVDATRTSRIAEVRDDAIELTLTHEYRFIDGSFDPVTIVSDGRADADGGYREALQLTYNQAWRQAPDPVFETDFTIPSASQLQRVQPEQIAVGPLGTGAYEEFERSTRTIRAAGAGEMSVLGTFREVVCFTEVRAGEVEARDGAITSFERRADLCFVQGLGLVSSRTEAGDFWEEWRLTGSTSARA